MTTNATPSPGAAAADEHVVVFRLGQEYYALDIQCVQEIVRMQPVTAIPGAEPWVQGVTNLRGRVVPVIDLRRRCNVPASDYTPNTRIVVISHEGGMAGLTVDAVSEVMRIPAEQIEPPGGIIGLSERGYLRGIAKLDDRLISLMDLAGILPAVASEAAEPDVEIAAA